MSRKAYVLLSLVIAFIMILGIFQAAKAAETDAVLDYIANVDPNPVVYGHRGIDVSVTVANNTSEFQVYDFNFWIGGAGWGGENYPYKTNGGTVYNVICADGCAYYWRGSLEPGQQHLLSMYTFSGPFTGTYDFLKVNTLDGQITKQITVTEGSGTFHGGIYFTPNPNPYDEFTEVHIYMASPKLTQFKGTAFTSTCDIQGFDGLGFVGHYNRTQEEFVYFFQIPRHQGCTISGKIESLWTGEIIEVNYYIMPNHHQVFLPFIVNP